MKVLFACSMGRNRSRTAAEMYAGKGHDTKYVGLYKFFVREEVEDALEWADVVFCMDSGHEHTLREHYGYARELHVLDIRDVHARDSALLKVELAKKVSPVLEEKI